MFKQQYNIELLTSIHIFIFWYPIYFEQENDEVPNCRLPGKLLKPSHFLLDPGRV